MSSRVRLFLTPPLSGPGPGPSMEEDLEDGDDEDGEETSIGGVSDWGTTFSRVTPSGNFLSLVSTPFLGTRSSALEAPSSMKDLSPRSRPNL